MGCREIVAISGRDSKKDEAFKLGATKFVKYVCKNRRGRGSGRRIEKWLALFC